MNKQKAEAIINVFLKDIFYRVLDIQAKQVSMATEKKLSRTEMHAIEIVKDESAPILTDVAEKLRVTKATASVCIDRLVKKGFVSKQKLKNDARKFSLALTESGDACYDQHAVVVLDSNCMSIWVNDLCETLQRIGFIGNRKVTHQSRELARFCRQAAAF